MSDWFTCKIKYLKQNPEDGSVSSKSEVYMLNALSYTEAEGRLQGILEEYIPEYNLLSCVKTKVQDVIIDEAYDYYYKIKVSYISADPDSGKEKKITENYIIQAGNLKNAYAKMEERLKGSIVDWEIPTISKTTVVDVFPYIEESDAEMTEETRKEIVKILHQNGYTVSDDWRAFKKDPATGVLRELKNIDKCRTVDGFRQRYKLDYVPEEENAEEESPVCTSDDVGATGESCGDPACGQLP